MGATPGRWPAPGGFDDIRVVEIGDEQGDFCGMLLAGEGADVIKVEPPAGSPSRRIGPFLDDSGDKDQSLFFWIYNRGKRSVRIDLGQAAGRQRYLELIKSADVVIDSQPDGLMDSLNLGYEGTRAANDRLVYCSITPFGLTGPWRGFKGSDLIHQALGGSAYCIGYPQNPDGTWDTPPFMAQGWQSYSIAAEHASVAIAAALFYRDTAGQGQFIDVSIHDACAQSTEGTVPRFIYTGRNQVRNSPQQLRAADGKYLALVITMLRLVKMPLLRQLLPAALATELDDPAFADPAYMKTAEATGRIAAVLGKWVATRSAVEAFHALQPCGVICAPVRPPEDLPDDEQCRQRDDFVEIEHPELGRAFLYPRQPSLRTETPWRWGPRAPLLGEHTEEVLGEDRSGA